MSRFAHREQLARLLAPRLLPDEEIVGNGAAWFAMVRGSRRLFVGRHYRLLALTDRRLLVFPRRGHRRASPLLDAELASLQVEHVGGPGVLFRVRLTTADHAAAIFEFRPHERALARSVVAAVGHADAVVTTP
jgi:hypothetical protein